MRVADAREAGDKQSAIHVVRQSAYRDGKTGRSNSEVAALIEKDEKSIFGVAAATESVRNAGVTLDISEDGKALQDDRKKRLDDTQWMLEWAQEMYKQRAEASEKNSQAFDDVAKAMEIARRIARGDIVPLKDEKKLIEFSADLYQVAKASAAVNANKKHKMYDSLYRDEDSSMHDKMRMLGQENEMADAASVSASMEASPQTGAAAGMKQMISG